MQVSDLIKQLTQFQQEHGDLQVRVYADHGQMSMQADSPVLGYIEEDCYSTEALHPDDADENSIKVCEVCA